MEHSFSGLFVPKTIHSHGGTFVFGNERSMDRSANGPWTVHSLDHSWTFVPGNEWTLDHSFTGTFVPNYKKVVKLVF